MNDHNDFVRPAPKRAGFQEPGRNQTSYMTPSNVKYEEPPRPARVIKLTKDGVTQTHEATKPEVAFFYEEKYDDMREQMTYIKVQYKQARMEYGNINKDLPYRITKRVQDEKNSTMLFQVEWFPLKDHTPITNFFDRDQLMKTHPKLLLSFLKENGVLYLGLNRKEEEN